MKNLEIAFRSLFKRGRSNVIKILSLAVGLAMGLVLIAKVCYESSFDTHYPDVERMYLLHEKVTRENELNLYPQISGGVIPAILAEIPEVEKAMRVSSWMPEDEVFKTADKRSFKSGSTLLADTTIFNVLPVPILMGNPKEILARPNQVMISRKLAEKMGGIEAAVGQEIVFDRDPGRKLIIGGVFENIPENSSLRYDMLLSVYILSEWSLNNWLGNDRYRGYIKLHEGADPKQVNVALREMQARHIDLDELFKSGLDLEYELIPLQDMYSHSKEVKSQNSFLALLAFMLLFATVMNYILIVVSTLINRSKEVAVYKCYGASSRNLLGLTLSEGLLHTILALIIAFLLILVFQTKIEMLLDSSLSALFAPQTMLVLLAVCVVIFLITALVPAYLYLHIPVASAFRNLKESRRIWKLALLFVQFVATAYFLSMLCLVNKQYHHMVDAKLGYSYENLLYCDLAGVDNSKRDMILNEVDKLPAVDLVSASYTLPIVGASGNNVRLPGDDRELFNIADLYWVKDNYFDVMEIQLADGEAFRSDGSASDKVMVSRKFVEKMATTVGWTGSAVGKSVLITEHSSENKLFTICGVYEDFCLGSVATPDDRASVIFYGDRAPILLIKMRSLSPDNIVQVNDLLESLLPDYTVSLNVYQNDIFSMHHKSRNFRDSTLIGGIITLLIALIGLMGYTSDEISRRSREIAIRKINGASAGSILKLISKDISYIAVPALLLGGLLAYFSGLGWMKQFAEKAAMPILLFIAAICLVYIILISCILYRTWRVANANPVDSIKAE